MTEELGRTGTRPIGPRAEHRDEVADTGPGEASLVGELVHRGAETADNRRFLLRCTVDASGDCHRIIAAHHGSKVAGCGQLVVKTAVCHEKNLTMADLPVNDPCQINPCFSNEIAAEFNAESGFLEAIGQRREAFGQRLPDPGVSTGSSPGK